MEERGNKTIICSVFFLDIVEYSKKSVSGQISLKERFNAFLSEAIRDVPIDDRIILDTGDGAAISFLGDVEDALRAALSMRDSLNSEEGLKEPPLLVRMGINLGPVRLVRDINGQPNIVGDGINVAQRVMGFAENGQILVSRSYYDAASRLSQAYAGMFQYVGSRTDKHVREHEVYIIGKPGEQTSEQRMPSSEQSQQGTPSGVSSSTGAEQSLWSSFSGKAQALYARGLTLFQQAAPALKAVYLGVPVVLLLLILLIVKISHKPAVVPAGQSAEVKTAPMVATQMAALPASAPTATAPVKQQSAAVTHKAETKKDAHKTEVKKDAHKADVKNDAKAKSATKKKQEIGVVMLTVKPWGEVYLDGKLVDVSPPLTKLEVTAGSHVIELKNANFPVYKHPISIKAGQTVKISYRFSN